MGGKLWVVISYSFMEKNTEDKVICQCGDANPNGNVSLTFKGGCRKELLLKDAYRCTGCNGWFHKDCILKHFELEKEHDFGRNEERKIWEKSITESNREAYRQGARDFSKYLQEVLKPMKLAQNGIGYYRNKFLSSLKHETRNKD